MATGRDIAEFLNQHTGKDYVGLYDEAVKEDQIQMENAKKAFNGLMEKINECDRKRANDILE